MPRWFLRLRHAVRSLVRPRTADRELNDELQFHFEREVQERMRAGLSRLEARRAAMQAMGPIETNREACRDLRRGRGLALFVNRLTQDVRFAIRLFGRHPGPVGIAVGGLAVAVGIAAATFGVVDATLLRPYGMDDPSSVISLTRGDRPAGWPTWSYSDFLRLRQGTKLATLEADASERVRFSREAAGEGIRDRPMLFVTGGYLSLFGGRPAIGRTLGPADDLPNAPPAVVVSHGFWRTVLGGDPSVVGRVVWVDDAPATLVGVLQPGFTGPMGDGVSIWAALAAFDDLNQGSPVTATAGPALRIVGRLAPGATRRAMEDNLFSLSETPATTAEERAHRRVGVVPASSPMDRGDAEDYIVLSLVTGLIVMVLALACANVSNLLMASACTRAREVGVRLAMGATRRRLVLQLVTESLLLGTAAGALGFVFAFWLVPIFGSLVELWPERALTLNVRVLSFTVLVALSCGLAAGLAPARYGARGNLVAALQAQSGTRTAAAIPSRLRLSFVGLQAAVSMLLLLVAALFTRSALRMNSVDIGFDVDRLVTVSFGTPRVPPFDEPAYVAAAVSAVQRVPAVERVSVSQYAPFGGSTWTERFVHDGRSFNVTVMPTDVEFFDTAGLRILHGRTYTADEVSREAPVALISESLARAFFADRDPIGRSLSAVPSTSGAPFSSATIIGVVADALIGRLYGQVHGAIYRPLSAQRAHPPALVVRSNKPGAAEPAIAAALKAIDPRVSVTTRFVRSGLDNYLNVRRRLAWVLGPAAAMSLVLAGLGIYGVTTFVVGLRTEEVSVRMALGASAADVLRLLVADSLRPVVIGLVVGLVLALAFSRFVAVSELSGVSPFDSVAIAVALATLLSCGLAAVLVPAMRAARVDPAELLRRA